MSERDGYENPVTFLCGVSCRDHINRTGECPKRKKPTLTPSSDETLKGTHAECLTMAMKIGWGISEVSRYCAYHNFKS
jgi:hypothetical protein